MGAGVALVVLLVPARASAAGVAVGQPGETLRIDTSRFAVAQADARTTSWAQVSVSGGSGGFVWILPLPPGATVDQASDAWLDALDAATTPVILPPADPAGYACNAGGPVVVPAGASPRSTRPAASGVFTDSAALATFVTGAGYALPQDVASAVGDLFASGTGVVASAYPSAALPTGTVRIAGSGPPLLPLSLGGPTSPTHVTAFVIAPDAATAGAATFALAPGAIAWGASAASAYLAQRDSILARGPSGRWLLETSEPGLLVQGVAYGPNAYLPAVVDDFIQLAASYAAPTGDAGACESADGGDDGGLPVDAPACGVASDDVALAVGSLPPASAWVTRLEGLVTPDSAADVPLTIAPGAAQSPAVQAVGVIADCTPATATQPPSLVPPPLVGNPGPPAWTPQPDHSSPPGSPEVAARPTADGCSAIADGCGNQDPTDDDDSSGGCGSSNTGSEGGGDASGDACGSDAGGSDCATSGQPRGRRRSPVSRVLVLLTAASAVARRFTRERGERRRA